MSTWYVLNVKIFRHSVWHFVSNYITFLMLKVAVSSYLAVDPVNCLGGWINTILASYRFQWEYLKKTNIFIFINVVSQTMDSDFGILSTGFFTVPLSKVDVLF